ncbi:biotin/lipoate--protein ligase family protein [Mesorhizobium sp. CAU 1732]|uniref:biotin/lipoate--protein ligase family protein n=1 Tax=Mesorhizobium sp. CAU 1732 TaxID=3140358 RepID=UPI003260154B
MSWRNPVLDHELDLPPPYGLVTLRESGDAFAHACAIAGERGAGTLVWVRRHDLAEFAVVLEPEEDFAQARRALYAGMNALADALAAHAPPSQPVTFDWPDAIRVDGVLVGGGRLGWPEGTCDDETPAWLVFSAMIRTSVVDGPGPGLRPTTGALDELGFETADAGEIITSFSRHLMAAFHEWNEDGFAGLAGQWLNRLPRGERDARIDDSGDLLLDGEPNRRRLGGVLASPTWLDPSTGAPWL